MITCPHCSGEFEPKAKRNRSIDAHRRFFKVIAIAYANWPLNHRLKPMCAHDVRIYLQLRAGWGHQIINQETGEVYLMPRSIRFSEMPAREFQEMASRVYRILLEETGMDHEKLLEGERQLQCA